MLHKTHVRRGWYALCVGMFGVAWAVSISTYSAWASGIVAQGTVTDQYGTGVANISMELHTPDGASWEHTTTDANGQYSFSVTLNPGTNYAVEARLPDGYNHGIDANNNNFLYQAGDATRTINFNFVLAPKTITGKVADKNGNPIKDAFVSFTSPDVPAGHDIGVHSDSFGNYTAFVTGGVWYGQTKIDLGVNSNDQPPQWINENPPVRLAFANDLTAEHANQDFQVTDAKGKVTIQLLNSDGRPLTTSDFKADVDFRRADGIGSTRKVNSDSVVSVYLTPGIYTISAYHNDIRDKSFDPAQTTFAITDDADLNLGTVRAAVNAAHLKGKVTNPSGQPLAHIQLQAIRAGGNERPTTDTAGDGTFDLMTGAGTWTIALNTSDSSHTQVTSATVTVTNSQTVSGLNIIVKDLDRVISGMVVNASGIPITDYVGSAYVRSSDRKARFSAPVVNGGFSVRYSSNDIPGTTVIAGVEASEKSTYTGGRETKVTIKGTAASKNIIVLPFNATLQGTLLIENTNAPAANIGSTIDIEAVDENGNFVSTTAANDGTYRLPISDGTWYYDYVIADPSSTNRLLDAPAGQNSVKISSGQTVTRNLIVRQGRNTISGVVTDASGAVVKSALVNIDNRATLEDKADTIGRQLVSATVQTDANGYYIAYVPDGTYFVSVGDTPAVASTQIAPDGKNVAVSGGQSVTQNLAYELQSASIKGKVTFNNKADGYGTVTAYSDNGKQESAVVKKDGTYTIPATSGDTWHVTVTDLQGKNLLTSEPVDIKPKKGANGLNLSLVDTGVDVPGPATKTFAASQGGTISLPDGASVTFPPFAVDLSGNVSVTMAPTIDLDKTMLDSPATIGYEVKAVNSAGIEVKQLNKPAEITVPYNQAVAEKNGLLEGRLEPTYYDPQTQTWESSGASGLVDTKNNVATISTTHLTKFSVTGTAKPLPIISNVASKGTSKGTVTIEIAGKNFAGKAAVAIGAAKASKVVVKGNLLKATFTVKSLKSGTQTVKVTNGNGRVATTTKKITASSSRVTIK